MTTVFIIKLSLLVFYVTCNDISVIDVTAQMCRRTEEEVWFRHTAPFSRLLQHAGDTEDVFST